MPSLTGAHWRARVMRFDADGDLVCTVCGWVLGKDNDVELHERHTAHLRELVAELRGM